MTPTPCAAAGTRTATATRSAAPSRSTAPRPSAGRTSYKGRTLTGIAPRPYGAPVVIIGEYVLGTPAAEQRITTARGTYGQQLDELLDQVRAALDAAPLDAARAQREPWWYDPAAIETCPRSAKLANPGPRGHLDLHARRKGEDCTAPSCVTHRRKAERRRATSYGITGPSVSALLGAAGFEARTDRTPRGFSATGDSKARCVWLYPGRHDAERLVDVLAGRGLVVTAGPGAGVLRVLARAEAERQGLDLPAPAAPPAPALPSTSGIRAALRRRWHPSATTRRPPGADSTPAAASPASG